MSGLKARLCVDKGLAKSFCIPDAPVMFFCAYETGTLQLVTPWLKGSS